MWVHQKGVNSMVMGGEGLGIHGVY